MFLDTKAMRHLTSEDWRVLTAAEMGSKNHEIVPTPLIEKIARLRGGMSGVHKSISALAKAGLIARVKEAKYDGFRLTYGGLDYLALHAHASRRDVYSVGSRIGVGKESDIMIVADEKGTQRVLKIHRLGRISFRTVRMNRDYLGKGRYATGSWMYLSRLAAVREYAFMKVLREEGFPVPEPIGQSRHTIVMSLIDAHPLRQILSVPDPASLYAELIALIMRLAKHGLIHGDFNEFNILIKKERKEQETPILKGEEPDERQRRPEQTAEKGPDQSHPQIEPPLIITPILIDFPQMVSIDHQNAKMYFDRDVNCIKRFFERRFHFVSTAPGPFFEDAKKLARKCDVRRLDAAVEASGFTKKMAKELEAAIRHQPASEGEKRGAEENSEDENEDGEESDSDNEKGSGSEEENCGVADHTELDLTKESLSSHQKFNRHRASNS